MLWIDGRFSWPFVAGIVFATASLLCADFVWRTVVLPFDTLLVSVALAEIARSRSGWGAWARAASDRGLQARALQFLHQVGLEAVADRRAATLGHGEKRQLELAMSFAAQPKLLLLDEPLAGLGPGDSERMVALLASLKGRYAMLLVEHDVEAVFSLADRISVLVAGRIIASGSAAEIRNSAEVRAAYLGEKE